jgi:hypothetical protein
MKWFEDPAYIKMCEKAVEIQKLAPCWFEEREYFYCNIHKCHLLHGGECLESDGSECDQDNYTWLPHQYQLQPIVKHLYESSFGILDRFVEYCANLENDIIRSYYMEQLWLVFVMKEKYGKVWTGKDWEAAK